MVDRDRLITYLDALLDSQGVEDACPNGLQVEGRERVERVVTGVSACRELFARAAEAGADLVLVHHGIFWKGDPQQLTGLRYRRVAELLRHDLNLAAYHLPLDRHPELGNNALAMRRLGVEERRPFGAWGGIHVGFAGRLPRALAPAELAERCSALFGQPALALGARERPVETVAVVSGAAASLFEQAIVEGVDAFVTGEPREWVMNLARESGALFLACGHYATERLGIEALGEHLAARFELPVEFVDLPNPV